MEEWEYLEGHRDLYKDVMMENRPPLTSPDGSRKRNPPERCPRPLYSRDSTQEHHEIPQTRRLYSRDSAQEHHEIPQTHPLCSRDSTQEDHTIHHENINQNECDNGVKEEIKEEEEEEKVGLMEEFSEEHKDPFKDIMMEPFSEANPPERYPRPLYSRNTTQEDHIIPHHSQDKGLIAIKDEVIDEEEQSALYDQQSAEEQAKSLIAVKVMEEDIATDKDNPNGTLRNHGDCSTEGKGIIRDSTGGNTLTHNIYPELYNVQTLLDPSNLEESSKKPFKCPDCGKCFVKRSELTKHHRVHTGEKPYRCLECGKCYTTLSVLAKHQNVHKGEKPFSCSECEKCFSQKAHLRRHQMLHTGEKPLTCPDCGKSFARKSSLIDHQRTHTGEKPFPCPECNKTFTQKSNLIRHQRVHRDEKTVICTECGKYFTHKAFVIHQSIHRGEDPFPCYQCGQCFTQKSELLAHQRCHAEHAGLS